VIDPSTFRDRLRRRRRTVLRELGAFGVVGAACTVLDLGLFQVLYAELGVGAVASRLVSTVVSVTVAYFAHRHWSFAHRARTGLRREYGLFFAVNVATLGLGLATVWVVHVPLGQEDALVLQAANVASIAVGTVLRFLCYRAWVFVSPASRAAAGASPAVGPAAPDVARVAA
jgi:putative flippase GtrA